MWDKHSNFETSTHSPLIISVPGQKSGTADALVEFVDIYPSLCELCGLPLPEGLEGTSFVPLIQDPNRPWKTAAFSQYPRVVPGYGRGMGHSMRTRRYRFTEWTEGWREVNMDPKLSSVQLPCEKQLSKTMHSSARESIVGEVGRS